MTQVNNNSFQYNVQVGNCCDNTANNNYGYLLKQPIGDTLSLSTQRQQLTLLQNTMLQLQIMMIRLLLMMRMLDIQDDGYINGSLFRGMNINNLGIQSRGNYYNNGGSANNSCTGSGASRSLMNAQPTNATRNPGPGSFGGKKLSQEQVNNARVIAEVGAEMGASKRDISIAIATAMQESNLKNLNYGDRDSVGLFQQRPSCGWGSVEQCTNPRYAAKQFFNHLLKDGNRHNKSLTHAAQDVQRSAYPDAYAKWENMAVELTNSIC